MCVGWEVMWVWGWCVCVVGVAQGIKDLSALPCLRSSGGGVKQASVKF